MFFGDRRTHDVPFFEVARALAPSTIVVGEGSEDAPDAGAEVEIVYEGITTLRGEKVPD